MIQLLRCFVLLGSRQLIARRPTRKGAANLLAFSGLCLLAMTSSMEAQGAVPTILISRLSGECINIPNGSGSVGVQMIQLPCRNLPQEQWKLEAVTGGYRIVSGLNGLCLEVANASTADGAAIQQGTCNGAAYQTWKLQVNAVYWSRLVANHSSKCLTVKSRDEGAPITQQPCSGDYQRWTISASSLPSFWSPKVNFTVIPAAAANMADGAA
jgi:Ricin-type beta-trefoil lectin domain